MDSTEIRLPLLGKSRNPFQEMRRVEQQALALALKVQLLVQAGIPRATAEAYYRPTLDPNAKR